MINKMIQSHYPLFYSSANFLLASKSVPILPKRPEVPTLPKIIKKNWFEKLILPFDDYDDMKINERRSAEYEMELNKYTDLMKVYQKNVSKILSETNLNIYRKIQTNESLRETTFAVKSNRDVLKGKYEPFFKTHLISSFGDKIKDNLEFSLPNRNAFVPDFAYVDESTGLCIDIEIDEPYTANSLDPIHCIGDDDYRNNYFTSKGWFVIRFEESQIAKQPKLCCEYIKNIITFIYKGIPYENSSIPLIERWNYHKAKELILSNYRQTY